MTENEISYIIRGAAITVHRNLGPGLLESVYETVLKYELQKEGLHVLNQVPVPIEYDHIKLDHGFRLDLLVESKVIIEVKSVENLLDVHHKQLLTYLKLADKKLGLLINFNSVLIKNSITRIVNNL
ncbi:MAG: GxxExxY protein [Balneolaceae bacterium]|nr:MAG: GxxExxY protein [Balneolaceae bacterium]